MIGVSFARTGKTQLRSCSNGAFGVVSQILIPPCGGSNPATPATNQVILVFDDANFGQFGATFAALHALDTELNCRHGAQDKFSAT
jgi:hypothetical protein